MRTVGRWIGALALVVGIGVAPPSVAQEPERPARLATGQVTIGSTPLPGADVIVRLWPDETLLNGLTAEDVVPFHTVGIGQTSSTGRYSFAVDRATLPEEYVDDRTGLVDVEVIVASDTAQARWSHSARPGEPLHTRFNFATGAVWEREDDPLRWVGAAARASRAQVAGTALGPITPDVRAMLGESLARGFNCDTRPGEIHYNLPERFMWVKGTDHAPVKVTQVVNNEHTMGVGLTYNAGGTNWSESGSMTKSFSASASKGGLQRAYHLWDAVNYRDYHNMCAPSYRRPYGYYDLISKVRRADTALPLDYCTIKRRGYVVETGSARNVTFANGVDIGPINVMANAGYDHGVDQKIVFKARRLFCWNNPAGWPASSKIGAWIPTANYD